MFKSTIEWIAATCGTDPTAITVISLMCMVGAYMTKDAMANPNGAFIAYPLLVVCSILTNWAFSQFGFFDVRSMDQWLVAVTSSSVLGMIAGLAIFIAISKSINTVADRFR